MSQARTGRRDHNNNGYNRSRYSGGNAQWIPRGSAPLPTTTTTTTTTPTPNTTATTTTTVVSSPTTFSSNQVGGASGSSVESSTRLPRGRNRGYPGPRGSGNGSASTVRFGNQRREKDRDGDNHLEKKGGKGEALPQLVQEIQDKLSKGTVECMICYDMVRRSAPIWSCCSCYSIFHLHCTKKWARAPTSVDLTAEKNQGFNWRCPGCQSVQLTSSREIRYVCFCGKRQDPPSDLYLTPHSCGEPCGKPLEKEVPGSGVSREDLCPHLCVLQCHPGPCPPCKAFAPPRLCPCGKKTITTRCSDRKSVLSCGQRCEKLLGCVRHRCEKLCHVGPCDTCQVLINASCFCKKKAEVILCGDMVMKGEVNAEDGLFSCTSPCGKQLGCGNHICREACHPGPCGECELLPSRINTCYCGKTSLQEQRTSCLDVIPSCSNNCGKNLPCGLHKCVDVCHPGECAPCRVMVTQKCRCGSSSRTVECFKSTTEAELFTCDKPCGRKKNCGRHRCSERCCPLSNPNRSVTGDWDPHLCSMPCEKKLRCGQHDCVSFCHSGHCPPCPQTIFSDLTCACGGSSIPPPLPCGTPPPSCQYPCSVPRPCGHEPLHSCHFGDCPPCSIPVAKECIGGHVVLCNIPCGSKEIRCNKICGKTRQCGMHACARTCHPPPCDMSGGSASGLRSSCGQTCGAPRRDCKHTCAALCHPYSSCPDLRCEFPVTILCSCGRITASVPCDAGGSSSSYNADSVFETSAIHKLPVPLQPVEQNGKKIPLGQRKLTCDDECAKVERKRLLADAFGVTPPNLEALHFGDSGAVSEVISDVFRRDPKWVLAVEDRCKALVLGKARVGANSLKVHVFCPMLKEKRDVVILIAERWKLSVSKAGWEPKRFIVIHATPKSKAPARILGAKGMNPISATQQPPFDALVDMDPRLVVALFDLPREADVSALVLRFGGECELVWLDDKNALAVFNDPARAATAMRRLEYGSVYSGAVAFNQNVATSTGIYSWGGGLKDASSVPSIKGNPWKKAVVQDVTGQGDLLWEDAEEWAAKGGSNVSISEAQTWRGKEAPIAVSANRWTALDPVRIQGSGEHVGSSMASSSLEGNAGERLKITEQHEENSDVVEDWEKAYD